MKIVIHKILCLAFVAFIIVVFSNETFAQTNSYQGAANGLWNVAGNWSLGVPTSGQTVVIPTGKICQVAADIVNPGVASLTVQKGAGLNHTAGILRVTGTLKLEAGDVTYPGGQYLPAGGTKIVGSYLTELFLKHNDSAGSVYVPYHLVSIPVTAANAEEFLHFWLFEWIESTNTWQAKATGNALTPGKGYAAYYSTASDQTVDFTGGYNSSLSVPLSYTGSATKKGGNLAGNPFTCALDWDDVAWEADRAANANLILDEIYFLNTTSAAAGSYAVYTPGSGGANGATNIIPAMQGFFVRCSAAGTLNYTPTSLIIDLSHNYLKSSGKITTPRLSLTAVNIANNFRDETVIHIHPQATSGLDYSYDAFKTLNPNTAIPNLYTSVGNEDMAINTFGPVTNTLAVPIHFIAGTDGNYTILADNVSSFDADFEDLILEDTQANTTVNLNQTPSYSFYANTGIYTGRFILHLKSSSAGIGEHTAADLSIYSYCKNVYIYGKDLRNGEVSVVNLMGQEVYRGRLADGFNHISLDENTGYYLVNVVSPDASNTVKVFLQ